MKRAVLGPVLGLLLGLAACAPAAQPQPQPVQVWEGSARVLLREQNYRLTFTVEPVGHRLSGTLDNRSSGDRFSMTGTLLPVEVGAELTAQISAGESPQLSASILGLGVSGLSLKADALLSGRVTGRRFTGTLRVGGLSSPITLRQTAP